MQKENVFFFCISDFSKFGEAKVTKLVRESEIKSYFSSYFYFYHFPFFVHSL